MDPKMNEDEQAVTALTGILSDEESQEAETAEVEKTDALETVEEPAVVAEGAEAPEAEPSQTEQEEIVENSGINWLDFLPQASPQIQLTPDENGQVDIDAYVSNLVNGKLAAQTAELKGWQEASTVLPTITSDTGVRDAVNKLRIADIANGGSGSLVEAAKSLKTLLGDTASKARAGARTSITIQKAAAIESGSGQKSGESTTGDDLVSRANSGDQKAVQELLASWVDDGKI